MARQRRQWSQIWPVIRRWLRETDPALSDVDPTDLVEAWNTCLDLRAGEMDSTEQNWGVEAISASIVAGQRIYSRPEGAERIVGVYALSDDGSTRIPLQRADADGSVVYLAASQTIGTNGCLPRWRPLGEQILIEPPFTYSLAAGLVIEADTAPDHFSGADGDKLSLRYPVRLETLLILDTVEFLLGVEDQLSNSRATDARAMSRFEIVHSRYAAWWMDYVAKNSRGPVFSMPGPWGA